MATNPDNLSEDLLQLHLEEAVRMLRYAQLYSVGKDLGQRAIAKSLAAIDLFLADLQSVRGVSGGRQFEYDEEAAALFFADIER